MTNEIEELKADRYLKMAAIKEQVELLEESLECLEDTDPSESTGFLEAITDAHEVVSEKRAKSEKALREAP